MTSKLPDFDSMPRVQTFLKNNPVCAALVRDLETIADTAKSLLEPAYEPSDAVWSGIEKKLMKKKN
jgi:hypothetical protein